MSTARPALSTEARVRHIISEHLGVEEEAILQDSRLQEDLDADSLDAVELTMALEEEFNLEIPDEDAEELTTVQQVVGYIERRRSS